MNLFCIYNSVSIFYFIVDEFIYLLFLTITFYFITIDIFYCCQRSNSASSLCKIIKYCYIIYNWLIETRYIYNIFFYVYYKINTLHILINILVILHLWPAWFNADTNTYYNFRRQSRIHTCDLFRGKNHMKPHFLLFPSRYNYINYYMASCIIGQYAP